MNQKKVVLITGAAQGQGKSHAFKFVENGFDAVLSDVLDPEEGVFLETVRELEQMDARVLARKSNITSTPDMEELFRAAWEQFGRIDVVIANAGIINFGNTWELTDDQVQKVIDINLIGTWRTDKYAARYMLKQGFGHIINISSCSGIKAIPQLATYVMSKHGVNGLTKVLAKELMGTGIYVNAICPTKVKTPMCSAPAYIAFINSITGHNFQTAEEMYAELDGSKPGAVAFMEPIQISNMCHWLATSEEARTFTGQEIAMDLGTLL